MKKIILVALLLSLQAFAEDKHNRKSGHYATCVGQLNNGETVSVEIRNWSQPFSLTGTVDLGNISEPIGLDPVSGGAVITSSQSRPLRMAVQLRLVRNQSRQLTGQIKVKRISDSKVLTGHLSCK